MNRNTRPPIQTRKPDAPLPSGGGRGNGYDQRTREFALDADQDGISNDAFFEDQRQQRKYPSNKSVKHWQALRQLYGHVRACRRTGNARATILRDHNIILLALYCMAFPKATAAEVNAFLYRANYGNMNFRFFSASQICEAEKIIGLTRKRGSTTAYQALRPINRQKRWMFWNLPYPYGIADIRREDMIDLDECGVEMTDADRSLGKAYIGHRVSQPGPFSKSMKINLLLAISGDDNNRWRWREMWTGEGTTGTRMITFIQRIINDIGPGTAQRRYCFTMDNLTFLPIPSCT